MILNRAKHYYENNKERSTEQAREKYKNLSEEEKTKRYYVSIIPDRYRSVPVFISDRPSVSIGTDLFRHDFCNGEGLERSDSESGTKRIG